MRSQGDLGNEDGTSPHAILRLPRHRRLDEPIQVLIQPLQRRQVRGAAARFLVGATRKGWREDFTLRLAIINGLPGVIVNAPEGPVQTAAFEIEGDVIRALYVVRNPDKLRHLAAASTPHESDRA